MEDVDEETIGIAETSNLPEFFVERRNKTEKGPPNAWKSAGPSSQVRVPARNIIRIGLPGIRGHARALGDNPNKTDVWKLYFDDEIMEKIVEYTNKKLDYVRSTLGPGTNKSNYKKTSIEEINALLGLLLLSSVLKSNNEKILSMFSKDAFSRPIFLATMSEKRFVVLISCLRFDDSCTRTQRK